jgi:hypothetical protein
MTAVPVPVDFRQHQGERTMKRTPMLAAFFAVTLLAQAQSVTTVKSAIDNCSAMRDYCSGFVTGALMLAPRTGELGLCDPNEGNGQSLGTTDHMLADWLANRVAKGYLSLKDDGYVAMTVGVRSLFPCKGDKK